MTIIQPLLIVILISAALLYVSKMRSKLLDRVIVLSIAAAGLVLVASPSLSTTIAHAVGVGRGVDLIDYLVELGGGFCLLLIFSRLRTLESQIAALVRELAILQASPPGERPATAGARSGGPGGGPTAQPEDCS